ncbi:MAG: hypothetical protein JJV89_01700 [Desulfosarcina sp.]|nr:hypothetical protein [Desulfobacterales bacterium]
MDKSSIINYISYCREAAKMSAMIPSPHHKRYNNMVLKKKWNNKKLPEWLHNELPWWKAEQVEFVQERRMRNLLTVGE